MFQSPYSFPFPSDFMPCSASNNNNNNYQWMLNLCQVLSWDFCSPIFHPSCPLSESLLVLFQTSVNWNMEVKHSFGAFLVGSDSNEYPCNVGTQVQSLGWEDSLEKEMATHSNTLVWRIPWTEEPGGLKSMRSQRVRHDWVTNSFLFLWHLYSI